MNSTAAIFARLNGSLSIIDRLDVFEDRAAIFNDRAPDDFQFTGKAALVIAAPMGDIDVSTFSETIRDVTQDVRLYARDTGSTVAIDDLGRLIRDLFHLKASQIEVEDGSCNIATATGPVAAPTTDPALIGRRVTLRLQLKKD
jgi:hypothetical protein